MLGIHFVYSIIEIDSIERIFGLFHLFLFWNNINRTHPNLDYDFQLQTASNTTTLLVALLYCNNGVVLLTGWSDRGVPHDSGIERAMLF